MAKLRELGMRRNGMQNTSLLSKSATCEQKFLLVVVIVMAKLRKTNQMHISSSYYSRSGWDIEEFDLVITDSVVQVHVVVYAIP